MWLFNKRTSRRKNRRKTRIKKERLINMKKISFLMLHLGYGGVESAISNQANMICHDFEVELVSLYKLPYPIPFVLNENVKIKYLSDMYPNREEFKKALKSCNLIKTIKEGIKAVKILILKKVLMKKYIKESEADIIISTRYAFNEMLGKYAKSGVVKIAQEHAHHNNNNKYIKKLIKSIENINYFMPVSQELTNFYKKEIKNKKIITRYIRHALDFDIPKYDFKLGTNLISVARLSKEKGFDDMLEVMSYIKKEIPNIKWHLIGDGVEKENIKSIISRLDLKNNVVMYGYKTRREINEIIKDCQIYCMTSLEESFGLSVIESMAFGLPCVGFDSAKGVLEIVNKDNGIMISKRNKEKMANQICSLLKNVVKLKTMSKRAYETSNKYSFDTIQKEWIEFYNEV